MPRQGKTTKPAASWSSVKRSGGNIDLSTSSVPLQCLRAEMNGGRWTAMNRREKRRRSMIWSGPGPLARSAEGENLLISLLHRLLLILVLTNVTCPHSSLLSPILTMMICSFRPPRYGSGDWRSFHFSPPMRVLRLVDANNPGRKALLLRGRCWGSLEDSYLDPSHVVTWP